MIEWIVTSSVLIAAVTLLRRLFGGRISPMTRYALWGLVLVRLLVPVNFGSVSFSAANLGQQVAEHSAVARLEETVVAQPSYEEAYDRVTQRYQAQGIHVSELQPVQQAEFETQIAREQQGTSLAQVLIGVWLAGVAAVGLVFLLSNLRFWRRLLVRRVRLEEASSPLRVYLVQGIDTPCLFGLLRPAIYLTPEAAEDPTVLRHTLAHEETHCRHLDHIWSVLRCLCLALHWYNPLVWWAAGASRRDGELACDQHTIRRLGEEERAQYGRTLIVMTCQKRQDPFVTATTMTTGKGGLRERILLIAKKPKMAACTLCGVLIVAALCVGCTFTGGIGEAPDAEEGTTVTYGQPVFPEGEIIAVTVHTNWNSDVRVTEEQLPEVTAWLATFAYGKEISGGDISPGSIGLTVAYGDGRVCHGGLEFTEVDGVYYEVIRGAVPDCWQEVLWGDPIETEPEYSFEKNVLYDREVPGHLNVVVTPTEVGTQCYFVPGNEYEFTAAMERAVEKARERTDRALGDRFAILLDGVWWMLREDGSIIDYDGRYIAPEDAAEVVMMLRSAAAAVGVQEPVSPGELQGIQSAYLVYQEVVYEVKDREKLAQIERELTGSTRTAGGSCPYDGLLTLIMEDGSAKTIALATDGCAGWLSEGLVFQCSGGSLYEMIVAEPASGTGRRIVATAPLNESGTLPPVTLEGVLVEEQDVPAFWALRRSGSADLSTWAKIGADALLGDYTVETDARGNVSYDAPNEATAYGPLRRYIALRDDSVSYNATWADTEHTPYYEDDPVTEERAIALAVELAECFGLGELLEGTTPEVRWDSDRSCYVRWVDRVDGLPLANRCLQVEVVGDDAAALNLEGCSYEVVTDWQVPGYVLSPEEALYCVNYARSLARENSIFEVVPRLKRVRMIWTDYFVWDIPNVDYAPAYAFEFVSQSGQIGYTVLVDPCSGVVSTQTNEGDYPSPYVLVG